ncbi:MULTISPECIES: ABC transporter ATP-binding protein [Calditerrivibrio]|uniref:ABC transporter ATP-binding protein n=1 Tax=Calditerrivibrio TaxID=545865 RepID=UPI003C7755F4
MEFIRIENLVSGYKDQFLLKSITLTLPKSSFLGIIGPNGSGKTTLLKTIAGILKPFSGTIYLNHRDLFSLNNKDRSRKIAYVSQFVDNKDIKVMDYVLAGRLPHFKKFQIFETQKDIEISRKFMNFFGIEKFKDRFMYELSGGQQQVVAICSALVQEPELLLLDEPTAHLDLNYQIKILDLIQELNTQMNISIISIFHDLNLASEYCNYLALLRDGELFKFGTPREVLRYDILEEIYKTVIVTDINPVSGNPIVLPASKMSLKSSLQDDYDDRT